MRGAAAAGRPLVVHRGVWSIATSRAHRAGGVDPDGCGADAGASGFQTDTRVAGDFRAVGKPGARSASAAHHEATRCRTTANPGRRGFVPAATTLRWGRVSRPR